MDVEQVRANLSMLFSFQDFFSLKIRQWFRRILELYEFEEAFKVIEVEEKMEYLLKSIETPFMNIILEKHMKTQLELREVFFKFFQLKVSHQIQGNLSVIYMKEFNSFEDFEGGNKKKST